MAEANKPKSRDLDRDPATGQPEDHLGGMAGGAFAGDASAGSVIGDIGGKAIAERIDPAHEDEYWRNEFPTRPYAVSSTHGWEEFGPAYRYGYERYPDHHGRRFDDVESELGRGWERARGSSTLGWDEARAATRDAFERIASGTK